MEAELIQPIVIGVSQIDEAVAGEADDGALSVRIYINLEHS